MAGAPSSIVSRCAFRWDAFTAFSGPTAPPVTEQDVAPAAAPKERVAEKPVETIVRRERYNVAVLQALDKVTAETLRFEAEVGRPVRWKGLIFTVSACERSAPNEPIEDSIVYLTIDAQPRPLNRAPSPACVLPNRFPIGVP
eukprot:gene68746-94208_t